MKRMKKWMLLLCLIMAVTGCGNVEAENDVQNEVTVDSSDISDGEANLEVHFIDVGQADCALLVSDGHYMLIDGGNNGDDETIVSYLKDAGVKKLDVVVGTHPHEDHIGSLDAAIESFDVAAVYMPKIMHTSQTFEDVLTAISDKGLKIKTPKPGSTFDFNGLPVEILAPVQQYDDFNNNSIVLRVTAGNTRFLFTGDAEGTAERDILSAGFDVSADVLKVGHHGSSTSTTEEFLNAINPDYAVISVGTENSYDHPEKETLNRLKDIGAKIYRTDQQGTIICKTDGKNITFGYGEHQTIVTEEVATETYIGNKNSKKFHRLDCSRLPIEKNRVYMETRDEAIWGGYAPCADCEP